MKLRRREFRRIHKSLFCCGRAEKPSSTVPVRRIEDPHHPRGYREIRSPAAMRQLLKRKIAEQNNKKKQPGSDGLPTKSFRSI